MDAAKAVERDLKRFDEITDRFETTGLVLGFVNLFIAVWARAPDLKIEPGSGVGLTVAGFNVGYAIVYGPLIAFMTMLYYLSILGRRDALRTAVLHDVAAIGGTSALSAGDRLGFGLVDRPRPVRQLLADRVWRALWYFIVPPLSAVVVMRRYFDFVPNEAAKDWHLSARMRFLLFNTNGWETRPLLPSSALEGKDGLMAHLPYIYPPWASWVEIALCLASVFMSWRAWRIYQRRDERGVTVEAD